MDMPPTRLPRNKKAVLIGLGILWYGFFNYITDYIPVGDSSLRPAVVILTVFGAYFGPFSGFLIGLAGSFLSDLLSGQVWWIWILANGVIGLFSGFISWHDGFDLGRGQVAPIHYVWLAIWGIAGNLLGLVMAAVVDLISGTQGVTLMGWAIIPAVVNCFWIVSTGIPIVALIAKRQKEAVERE